MNVYIWKQQDKLTTNYHSGGGAIAIAESLEAARDLFRQTESCLEEMGVYIREWYDDDEKKEKTAELNSLAVFTKEPDMVWELAACPVEPYAEIFPNAGCC